MYRVMTADQSVKRATLTPGLVRRVWAFARDYRLRVHGLVEHPVELSLDEIRALGKQEQITAHNCIQGWSGIARWGGLPLSRLVELWQAGVLRPVIDSVYDLSDADAAFDRFAARGKRGRVLLKI